MILNTNHFSEDDDWDKTDEEDGEDDEKLGEENWGDSLENDDDDSVN